MADPKYVLTIDKIQENELYEKQMEDYDTTGRNWGRAHESHLPQREITMRHLNVTITLEEFEKIKHALIELWQ